LLPVVGYNEVMLNRLLMTLAGIACAAAIVACGSASSSRSVAAASGGVNPAHVAAALRYADCMRSHGVTHFPDPNDGGGIQLGTGVNPQSPAFKSAQQVCGKLFPGGGPPGSQHPSAQLMAQMLKISECMRRHGVSGFPDPTLKLPANPNPSDYSILEDRGGAVLAVPSTIKPGSPTFKKADAACGFS
jgi:hypothetical protein